MLNCYAHVPSNKQKLYSQTYLRSTNSDPVNCVLPLSPDEKLFNLLRGKFAKYVVWKERLTFLCCPVQMNNGQTNTVFVS